MTYKTPSNPSSFDWILPLGIKTVKNPGLDAIFSGSKNCDSSISISHPIIFST